MLAYVLSGIDAAINVLVIYQNKVSVKNKKTLIMIIDRLNASNHEQQKQYFDLLLKNIDWGLNYDLLTIVHIRFILRHGITTGCKMKYKKKKEPKKQPPVTIIGDCVTRKMKYKSD